MASRRNFSKNLEVWITPMNIEMKKPLKNWRGMLYHLNTIDPGLKRHISIVSPTFGSYLNLLRNNIRRHLTTGEISPIMLTPMYNRMRAKSSQNAANKIKATTRILASLRGRIVRKRFQPRLQELARVRRQAEANARAAKKIEEQRLRAARQAENNAARAEAVARSKAEATAQREALKARRNAARTVHRAENNAASRKKVNYEEIKRMLKNNRARLQRVNLEHMKKRLSEFPNYPNKANVLANIEYLIANTSSENEKVNTAQNIAAATIRSLLSTNIRSARLAAAQYQRKYGNLPQNIRNRLG